MIAYICNLVLGWFLLLRLIDEGTGGEVGVTAIHGGIVLPIDGAADGDGAAGAISATAHAYAVGGI